MEILNDIIEKNNNNFDNNENKNIIILKDNIKNTENNSTEIIENKNSVIMVLPNNELKYLGHIREFENRYTFEYISKNLKAKELFYFKDLGSKENAKEAALLFQKKWCQNNNKIINLYYIINNKYVIVDLNNNSQMKVDIDDIPLIESYNWRLQNNSIYVSTFKIIDNQRTFTYFYKMKFKCDKIHFRNNDKFDYRNENIIII